MSRDIDTSMALPQKGVLFLGGHQNMTKKLRQKFPKWQFITDDTQLNRYPTINRSIVFYWSGHSSHKMMRNVYRKLPADAQIIFVTATNIPLLITEMHHRYLQSCF